MKRQPEIENRVIINRIWYCETRTNVRTIGIMEEAQIIKNWYCETGRDKDFEEKIKEATILE